MSTNNFEVTGPSDLLVPVWSMPISMCLDPATSLVPPPLLHINGAGWVEQCQTNNCGNYYNPIQDVVWVSSNTPIDVFEQAAIDLGGTVSGFAQADPFFAIDSGFLGQNPGYQLVFSDGVDNVLSSVPEPATWTMMLVGVGMIGVGLRVARRKNALGLSAT